MKTLPCGAHELMEDTSSSPPLPPPRSPSRLRPPKGSSNINNTDFEKNPMPRSMTLQDCSKSDETFSSIPDSAIAGVESKEESTISLVKPNRSDATIFSNKDSAVDVNSPAAGKVLVSSPDFVMGLEEVVGDALRTADLNAAQAKARNVYSNSSLPPPITSPEAGLSLKAAKAATGSVFIENFSPPSTRSLSPSLHHSSTVARPSRSNSPRIHLLNTSGTLSRVNSLSNPSAVSAWPPFQIFSKIQAFVALVQTRT